MSRTQLPPKCFEELVLDDPCTCCSQSAAAGGQSSFDAGQIRSPVGSFTKRASSFTRQIKSPGSLILDSLDSDNTVARRSFTSASPCASLSPKPGRHADPIAMWPVCASPVQQDSGSGAVTAASSPGHARTPSPSIAEAWVSPRRSASTSGIAQQRKPSGEIPGSLFNDEMHTPRRQSLTNMLHGSGTTSPYSAPLLHASSRQTVCLDLNNGAVATCSVCPDSLEDSAGCSSSGGSQTLSCGCSPAAAVVGGSSGSSTELSRRHWPKPAVPATSSTLLAGKQLQNQTHAALQQLAAAQPARRRERLAADTPLSDAVEVELQRCSLQKGAVVNGNSENQC